MRDVIDIDCRSRSVITIGSLKLANLWKVHKASSSDSSKTFADRFLMPTQASQKAFLTDRSCILVPSNDRHLVLAAAGFGSELVP